MGKWFVIDGQFVEWVGRDEAPPDGAVPLPRKPREFETLKDGQLVLDRVAKADSRAGQHRIGVAHAAKLAEAAAILSGHQLTHGFLAAEAKALGVALSDLAASVYQHAQPLIEAEVARRKAKAGN